MDAMLESQSPLNPIPFDYFCQTTRSTLSKRYCPLCSIYFATQADLKRHKSAKVCWNSNNIDDDWEEDVPSVEEQEGDDIVEVMVVEEEATPTHPVTRRSLFDMFSYQFEEE